jgi:hypothetical protein
MPYAHKVTRYTISGTCLGGSEIWTTSFFAGLEGADAVPPVANSPAQVAAAWSTFFTAVGSKFSGSYKTTEVKAAYLNVDGKTDLAHVEHYAYPTPISGFGSTSSHPPQITLVATLASTLPRGIASKGRMFLPGHYTPIDATGHVPAADVTSLLTNFRTFINACNSSADLGGVVMLASRGRTGLFAGTGVNKAVASVKIGNVYDTQRRRRDNLVESYSGAAIP